MRIIACILANTFVFECHFSYWAWGWELLPGNVTSVIDTCSPLLWFISFFAASYFSLNGLNNRKTAAAASAAIACATSILLWVGVMVYSWFFDPYM